MSGLLTRGSLGSTYMLTSIVAWYDARRGGRAVVISWLVTRLLILALLATAERFVVGDVFYYHRKIAGLFDAGLGRTLNEYPTPVVWLLWLPYGATIGSRIGYLVAFIALMLALDAAFTRALYRSGGRRHDGAIDFWLIFVLLIGPLSYLRFDLLPAVLAGGALLAARRRPWLTGALTGLGAAIKLWPALLIPAFLSFRRDRRPAGLAFVGVGFGLALLSLIIGGGSRLTSPLTWQSDRGLQIESIWATPLMALRAISPDAYVVDISKYQAYEIFGPGAQLWVTISSIATLLGLIGIAALYFRAFRAHGATPTAIGFVVLAIITIMTVTNKTLSPQYLLWLGGPMAAMLLARTERAERKVIVGVARQLVLLALLTHLIYPLLYDGFLGRQGYPMIVVATMVTAVRNVALLAFTVEVCRYAWRFLAPDGASHLTRSTVS